MSERGDNFRLVLRVRKEFYKPTKYFVRCDVDGSCYAFYRQRWEGNKLFEESWLVQSREWLEIPGRLIWMQISGECTLEQVSFLEFQQLVPEALCSEINDVPK